jgi:proline dehydrogenase
MRKVILTTAGNPSVTRLVSRYGLRLGARRFVAGERWEQAVGQVQALNERGILATLDYLGESVTDRTQALAARDTYLDLLDRIQASEVKANVSLKLTQMGLDLSTEFCLENVAAVVRRARERGNFVRIDMEDSARTDRTIEVFRALRADFDNVGLVLQAYLYRSERDLRALADLHPNLRLCKGAYLEPRQVAFPRKADVDDNFRKLIALSLELGNKTAVATHDEKIIAWTEGYVREKGIPPDLYEFQMLFGIRSQLQRELAEKGHTVRVYVPFGEQWYPYFTRRLAERPANVLFLLANFWRS